MSASPAPAEARPQVAVVPGVVEVVTTCCVEYHGRPVWLRGGDIGYEDDVTPPRRNRSVLGMLFADDHELVRRRPDLFRKLELRLEELPD